MAVPLTSLRPEYQNELRDVSTGQFELLGTFQFLKISPKTMLLNINSNFVARNYFFGVIDSVGPSRSVGKIGTSASKKHADVDSTDKPGVLYRFRRGTSHRTPPHWFLEPPASYRSADGEHSRDDWVGRLAGRLDAVHLRERCLASWVPFCDTCKATLEASTRYLEHTTRSHLAVPIRLETRSSASETDSAVTEPALPTLQPLFVLRGRNAFAGVSRYDSIHLEAERRRQDNSTRKRLESTPGSLISLSIVDEEASWKELIWTNWQWVRHGAQVLLDKVNNTDMVQMVIRWMPGRSIRQMIPILFVLMMGSKEMTELILEVGAHQPTTQDQHAPFK
ncbi:hypothetical protein BKA64DRAFT_639897 [Cadophora sp. MPI-SDFR-AT-0126]|nr:hypothetical protein BKA64DRAFT_639897 [Leotiomycetes sp. MPI-SDFR-AT-0126]